ncbi:response regulator transcription factor [Ktedonosporobacter rubrisoli]|uniref:Response regulator transcription factor n=1 Tax=Ktedonosporobacter rubrisoli TaxID=2509675 RepID=A0A4P6K3C3_KTERU|nr:response regulator transcription factor [Ktedonosporobacter rubrisoli]QBD82535.1 response regulator transcription factor [Ktedonosporobacter rubrisoli]
MDRLRLLIADDHAFYREGVQAMLQTDATMEVVGEACNGEQAITLTQQLQPDLVLMDIKMPGINGIDATRLILKSHPQIRILVVTIFDDDSSVFAALRAGARGYLLKDAHREELIRAVKAVSNGEAIFSSSIAQRMIHYFTALSAPSVGSAFPELNNREREILHLMAQGYDNPAIARQLALSLKTIQNYVSNILNKLQATDRFQAIVRARKAGFGQEER